MARPLVKNNNTHRTLHGASCWLVSRIGAFFNLPQTKRRASYIWSAPIDTHKTPTTALYKAHVWSWGNWITLCPHAEPPHAHLVHVVTVNDETVRPK